ncbi:cyclin-dependent kinase B1-1 [Rosa sericea]
MELGAGAVWELYESNGTIGTGRYGAVHKAVQKATGQTVALKEFEHPGDGQGFTPEILRQVALLKDLNQSRYVVDLIDVETPAPSDSSFYLVFECLDMNLGHYVSKFEPGLMPRRTIKMFVFSLCKGMAHIHSHFVIHRDLKPDNLFVDEKRMILKIGDLGVSRSITTPATALTPDMVSYHYRAPEIYLGGRYGRPVDMWSVGCVFAEMLLGKPLFYGRVKEQALSSIFRTLGVPTEEQWPDCTTLPNWNPDWNAQASGGAVGLEGIIPDIDAYGLDLLYKMLTYDPAKRITAKQAMKHPYFDRERETFEDWAF